MTPTAFARQRLSILMVEDNPADADLVRAALDDIRAGFRLDHVARLGDAMERLSCEDVDVVLLDLSLPDSLGVEGVQTLRAAFPKLPIVVLTGSREAVDAALGAGAQDYLVKGEIDGNSFERALRFSIERQRHLDRALELSVERAARQAAEALGAQLARALEQAERAKEREAAARIDAEHKRRELEALFGSMIDAVVVFSSDERIVSVNAAALEIFGDVRGFTPTEFLERIRMRDAAGRPLPAERLPSARALTGEIVRAERVRVHTLAGERAMLLSSSPLRGDPEGGAVSVYRDVTDHEQLLDALRETNERKNHFLAVLSHELRNPLAPIRNSVYILDRVPPAGEQARRARAVIDRQVHHMTRLVDDLLDVTRIAEGKIRLQRERLELNAVVRHTAEDHHSVFAKNGVELATMTAPYPIYVDADAIRIAQVIGNLLQNAAKFTPRGGRAVISLERDGESSAVIRVRDSGTGVAPEEIPSLFEPFVQAEKTLDRSHGGLGLGLALVKGLVELHGGGVSAQSAGAGRGTEFAVTLPLDRAGAPRLTTVPSPAATGSPRRILIIDDNVDLADSLREVLEMQDHVVELASTGPQGLQAARVFQPDVVICDIGLPEMDGFQVASALRSDPAFRSTALIALSGYGAAEDLERARQAGFDRHVAKPIDPDDLEQLLAELAPKPADEMAR